MSSENPTRASKPLTVDLILPDPQALLRFAPKSGWAGNDGPRKVASTHAPAGTSPGIDTPMDPGMHLDTESAAGVTCITWPVTV